jgi:hypothetical protein
MKRLILAISIIAVVFAAPLVALAQEEAIDEAADTVEVKQKSVETKAVEEKAPAATIQEKTIEATAPEQKPATTAKAKETAAAKETAKPAETAVEPATTEEANKPVDEFSEDTQKSAGEVEEVKVKMDMKVAPAYSPLYREKSFRAGLVGPGIYAGNKSINVMMGVGAEAEYFFFERLSAGLRIQVATDFKSNNDPNTILSFVPQARYFFDFASHPRWSVYVQGGAGVALIDGMHAAADIAIPGGGFCWQYNQRFSIGFEATLHVLARSTVAFAAFAGPTFRYQF